MAALLLYGTSEEGRVPFITFSSFFHHYYNNTTSSMEKDELGYYTRLYVHCQSPSFHFYDFFGEDEKMIADVIQPGLIMATITYGKECSMAG
jgi:hypothetical protein